MKRQALTPQLSQEQHECSSPLLNLHYSAAHLEAESQVSGLGPGFPFGNFYIWELVKQKKLTTILARTFLLRSPLCVNRILVISVILVYRTKMCYR